MTTGEEADPILVSLYEAADRDDWAIDGLCDYLYEHGASDRCLELAQQGFVSRAVTDWQGFYYGYYSAEADYCLGHSVYEKQGGGETKATYVAAIPAGANYGWKDARFVGRVTNHLRVNKFGRLSPYPDFVSSVRERIYEVALRRGILIAD